MHQRFKDAGSTADITMLWSAMVCLGLQESVSVCYILLWPAIVCLGLEKRSFVGASHTALIVGDSNLE